MPYTHELYNRLPTIHNAHEMLLSIKGGPDTLLNSLTPLFIQYPQFGVCLVHAHCTLTSGEKMVSSGNISEPKIVGDDDGCYPERWLSNGDPYEFSSTPTIDGGIVPKELLDGFSKVLGDFEGRDLRNILGIYAYDDDSAGSSDDDGSAISDAGDNVSNRMIWVERTVGRANVLELAPKKVVDQMDNVTTACWAFRKDSEQPEKKCVCQTSKPKDQNPFHNREHHPQGKVTAP